MLIFIGFYVVLSLWFSFFSLVCVPLFFILCLHISLLICRLLQIWQLWAMLVLTPLCALQCLAPRPVPLLKALSTLPVMVSVKTLKASLELVYALVKSHCMYGHAGVATFLFNNFLGLWDSSMIRKVNETLQLSSGRCSQNHPVTSTSRFVPGSGANQGGSMFTPRRGSLGGCGAFGDDNFHRNSNSNDNEFWWQHQGWASDGLL